MSKRLIKLPEVQAKVARRKSAVYDGMAREIFPKLVSPGTWAEHEIDHLIEIEIKARNLGLRGKAREDFIRAKLANGHKPAAKNGRPATR